MSRTLTGKWFIKVKETTALFGLVKQKDFKIMVEVKIDPPFAFYPNAEYFQIVVATDSDIVHLGINIL